MTRCLNFFLFDVSFVWLNLDSLQMRLNIKLEILIYSSKKQMMSTSLLVGYLQPSLQEEHTHSLLMTSVTVACLMIINPKDKPKDKK